MIKMPTRRKPQHQRKERHIAGTLGVAFMLSIMAPASDAALVFADSFDTDLPLIPDSPGSEPSDRHSARPLGTTDAALGYYEYLPPGYETGGDYPLLVFVHGLGENGNGTSQLDQVLRNGPPRLIDADDWNEQLPFLVLSPQNSFGGCMSSNRIEDFIDFARTEYRINAQRVYLTGLSCGAIGSWNYASNLLDTQIAAMVPIAGDGRGAFNRAGCALGALPIWAFHGDDDPTVNVQGTTVPINALNQCTTPAPIEARMTIYPGVGHNSWRRTYNLSAGHDIYAWLLSYRLAD